MIETARDVVQNFSDAGKWAEQLWSRLEHEAHVVDGSDVIRLLRETSDAVWDSGLDKALGGAALTSERAVIFDITWLSILLAKIVEADKTRTA